MAESTAITMNPSVAAYIGATGTFQALLGPDFYIILLGMGGGLAYVLTRKEPIEPKKAIFQLLVASLVASSLTVLIVYEVVKHYEAPPSILIGPVAVILGIASQGIVEVLSVKVPELFSAVGSAVIEVAKRIIQGNKKD